MTLVAILLGGLAGFGLMLVVAGLGGRTLDLPRPQRSAPGIDRLALRVALAVAGGAVMAALTGWPVGALLVAVAGFLAPDLVGSGARRGAEIARLEAIAAWAEMLRDTMAAAGGLEQSIVASAAVAPPAIRTEVQVLAARLSRQRLAPALREFADELADPTADLVVAALLLAADKSPKRLGALLGALAKSTRAEVTMRLRVEAGRARTRTSVRVVTVSTIAFAAGLLVFNRSYLEPYDSALGQAVLGLVGLCFGSAFWWLARSARIDTSDRFLQEAPA